jgi:uncharacterized phosphosugar-binding protein
VSGALTSYFDGLRTRLAALQNDEAGALARAADVCADVLAAHHVIHLYDTGHIISHEMIARTGGLVAYTPFSYRGVLDDHNLYRASQPIGHASSEEMVVTERALLDWVFAQGTLRTGDVLIIGSVSGTGARLVELACQARKHGLTVIALTAPAFSGQLPAQHPSGQRLFEVADLVLDNHAEYGDSFLCIDGLERKVCPISGIGATVLMWALTAGIVERLVGRGLDPSVYTSVNVPGGPQAVAQVEAEYRSKGY